MVEEQVDARARNEDRELLQKLGRLEAARPRAVAPRPPQAQQDFALRGQLQRVLSDGRAKWATAKQLLGAIFDLEKTAFRGTPAEVTEQLLARRAEGVTFFTTLFSDFHDPETLQLFAEEVVPALSSSS